MCPKCLGESNVIPQTQGTPVTISRGRPSTKPLTPSCPALNKMAYRTIKRGRRSYTRRTTRKGYGGPSTRRRYPTKRRRYPRKMTNKRILNVTSRKKRDTMLSWSKKSDSIPQAIGPYIMDPAPGNGGMSNVFLWMPTFRDLDKGLSGTPGGVSDPATRTASTCYMRGLKESIEIQTSSGMAWQWRRICFTSKDPGAVFGSQIAVALDTSNGYARYIRQLASADAADAAALETLRGIVFRGQIGRDWSSYITAPVDNSRVTVRYDRTMTFQSGNQTGVVRKIKMWHAMNSNLVYDDDENGASNTYTNGFSTSGKAGMGNFFVMDVFMPGIGATSADKLSFDPCATLYWHEK